MNEQRVEVVVVLLNLREYVNPLVAVDAYLLDRGTWYTSKLESIIHSIVLIVTICDSIVLIVMTLTLAHIYSS